MLVQALPQSVGIDEVLECILAVDLDDRDRDAVPLLELRVPADVDELELESELGLRGLDDVDRVRAEPAVGGVVEGD